MSHNDKLIATTFQVRRGKCDTDLANYFKYKTIFPKLYQQNKSTFYGEKWIFYKLTKLVIFQ